jgi:two-component system, cell cycle response regulator
MAASDTHPAPPQPSEPPKTSGEAVLEPPARRPPALSADPNQPGATPILVVIHSKDAHLLGRRFVLDRSPVHVGRGGENDIVLRDASVSPRHAHFERHEASWWCVDEGSTDGVYIDDRRTSGRAPLDRGIRIGIGSTIFKFLSGRRPEAQYYEEIYRITVLDGLTQVWRERYLIETLDKEIARARRYGRALALLTIEIDELAASVGSSQLPNAGDHLLTEVAGVLRRSVPRAGIVARYGDERFVALLPDHTLEMARVIAEALCENVAASPLAMCTSGLRVTVSIGGARRRDDDLGRGDILERASRALRVAKSRGRGQLECEAVDDDPSSGRGA